MNPTSADEAASPIKILDIPVHDLSMERAIDLLVEAVRSSKTTPGATQAAFVNADCLNISVSNARYRALLQRLPLVFGDGSGVRYASRILGKSISDNVNGTDMFPLLCERLQAEGLSIYFLGAKPGVAEAVAQRTTEAFPELRVAGFQHGYFAPQETDAVIESINASRADVLLVAFGAPRQDLWIDEHRKDLDVGVAMGVGGLFDFMSGNIPRAPLWLRRSGFEWTYRLYQEPGRMWQRYVVGNPAFLMRAVRYDPWDDDELLEEVMDKYVGQLSPTRRRWQQARAGLKRWIWKAVLATTYGVKRGIDIFASGLGLIVLSPLFFVTWLAIKVEDPGPAFFHQERVGKWGKTFTMHKFRSMVMNADKLKDQLMEQNESEAGVIFKMKRDPRITKVGRIIRKLSIDELPQLYNVLKGDMSLVGPRPPVPREVAEYSLHDRRRLDVIPGITGLWQVSGRSDIDFEGQVRLDVEYIKNQGVLNDLMLLLKTIPAVLLGKGAY